ncbi:hypothetical protein B0H17DRAFT_1129983 [Mycena rosella]|uniref:Uncharacterized protein n=1 Tax=Mycena rosella TaxID=1033263 RepID=A0AAD7DRH3_MYCRO|nr:hypothetical protein B0H17DRAFT_1129983 [Mycena rosella]
MSPQSSSSRLPYSLATSPWVLKLFVNALIDWAQTSGGDSKAPNSIPSSVRASDGRPNTLNAQNRGNHCSKNNNTERIQMLTPGAKARALEKQVLSGRQTCLCKANTGGKGANGTTKGQQREDKGKARFGGWQEIVPPFCLLFVNPFKDVFGILKGSAEHMWHDLLARHLSMGAVVAARHQFYFSNAFVERTEVHPKRDVLRDWKATIGT